MNLRFAPPSLDPAEAWRHEWLPQVLPAGWAMVQQGADGAAYMGVGLAVIASADVESDGRRWAHVSLSRKHKMPSYEDIKLVKDLFIGPDREAYQVFPAANKHVNIHKYCLHLWTCLDGPALPDFTRGLNTI